VIEHYWEEGVSSPGIFINYRDPDYFAAALLDDIAVETYGPGAVFKASRSIPAGDYFPDILIRAARRAGAMLVVIGEGWTERLQRDADQEDEEAWTLREIVEAQNHGVHLLPVYLMREGRPSTLSSAWQEETRYEDLSEATLPPGINTEFACQEGFNFGTRDPRGDFQNIATALATLVPELHPQ
jgi:hypothetical protein